MLEQRQIKKMARTYSDKQIIKEGVLKQPLCDGGAWTNGDLILFEQPPDLELTDTAMIKEWVEYYGVKPSVRVWPVSITQYTTEHHEYAPSLKWPIVEFSDGNGTTAYANGRYVSALFKRAKKQVVEWEYVERANALVGCLDGERLGVVMRIDLKKDIETNTVWSLSNRDIPQ